MQSENCKKGCCYNEHEDAYNLRYGEVLKEQGVIAPEGFHTKSYNGINYAEEKQHLPVPFPMLEKNTEDKEKCHVR